MNGGKESTRTKPAAWLEVWSSMQALRSVRLDKLGRATLPEEQPAARIIGVLGRCGDQLLAIAQERDGAAAAQLVEWAWEEYLRDEWGASLTPPFALSGFANVTMLSRCWQAAEVTLHEAAEVSRAR